MQDATCILHRLLSHCVGSTEHMTFHCKPSKNTKHCGLHRRMAVITVVMVGCCFLLGSGNSKRNRHQGTSKTFSLRSFHVPASQELFSTIFPYLESVLWKLGIQIWLCPRDSSWILQNGQQDAGLCSLGSRSILCPPFPISHHNGIKRSPAVAKCKLGAGEPHIFFKVKMKFGDSSNGLAAGSWIYGQAINSLRDAAAEPLTSVPPHWAFGSVPCWRTSGKARSFCEVALPCSQPPLE